jgi:uncharacterized protein YecE (DUF72 family)
VRLAPAQLANPSIAELAGRSERTSRRFPSKVTVGAMKQDLSATATAEDLWAADAATLPSPLHLGTSTWAFPDWKGLVYKRAYKSEREFTAKSLEEYATVPWFRTVCIDSLFYNPPKADVLLRYASQVPSHFRWVSKVWERITVFSYPRHARYGAFAGTANPDFLNADLLCDRVLTAYDDLEILAKTGPFVFQFAPFSQRTLEYEEFTERLDVFLSKLPKHFMYAVEVRNAEILTPNYFQMLNRHGVTHCFNHWNSMVPLREQMRLAAAAGGLTADFYVARLLTPLGLSYEGAAKALEPYVAVKRPNEQMRADVVLLARRALKTGKRAFVTANNKAEGNAPLTMVTLAKLIVESIESGDA